jgi:BirA family biotin operon repressor/biotin-[acetyl-CoA-carboxylase] ligase
MSAECRPSITPDQLREGWSPRRIGRQIVVLPDTTSTNTAVLELAAQHDARVHAPGRPDEIGQDNPDGLVVLADYQTMGRGRQGRKWMSPRGASVLCSALIISDDAHAAERGYAHERSATRDLHTEALAPPRLDDRDPWACFRGRLTLATAVAACEAVCRTTELTPAIKWPNDLRVRGRKLGGILIESRPARAGKRAWAMGIGINCLQQAGHFPPELRKTATSLEMESSHAIDRLAVTRALLQRLDAWLAVPPAVQPPPSECSDQSLHSAWLHYAEPLGRRVRVMSRGRQYAGSTIAVDPSGGLILQSDDGRREWLDPMQSSLL